MQNSGLSTICLKMSSGYDFPIREILSQFRIFMTTTSEKIILKLRIAATVCILREVCKGKKSYKFLRYNFEREIILKEEDINAW